MEREREAEWLRQRGVSTSSRRLDNHTAPVNDNPDPDQSPTHSDEDASTGAVVQGYG